VKSADITQDYNGEDITVYILMQMRRMFWLLLTQSLIIQVMNR